MIDPRTPPEHASTVVSASRRDRLDNPSSYVRDIDLEMLGRPESVIPRPDLAVSGVVIKHKINCSPPESEAIEHPAKNCFYFINDGSCNSSLVLDLKKSN